METQGRKDEKMAWEFKGITLNGNLPSTALHKAKQVRTIRKHQERFKRASCCKDGACAGAYSRRPISTEGGSS